MAAASGYSLAPSEQYFGFLEIVVRPEGEDEGFLQPGDPSMSVETLTAMVIGDRDTPAYGLTEKARIHKQRTIQQVGIDGWQALIRLPKLTATTFVLLGGQFEDVDSSVRPSQLGACVNGVINSLVPDLVAARLAENCYAAGNFPGGLLARICDERQITSEGGWFGEED
ncbi:unnamed protein product, partial [Polarella glacialis]